MVRCPHCGLYHNATIEYCPEKGLPIYQPKAVEIHSKPNLLWLVIVVAILLTALCAVSAIYFIPNFLKPKIIPNNQVPVSVPTLTLEPLQTRISELFTPTIAVTNTPPEPTATLIPTDSAWQACEDVDYPSHLHPGMQASVALDPPLPNRVREDPSTNAKILGYVDPGGKVEILEGPSCQEGWIWWRVKEISTDLTGWTAEGNKDGYWLIPE
ncbi:MAG: SH3 domain-containing protein [Anaerolineaceae bacterium]